MKQPAANSDWLGRVRTWFLGHRVIGPLVAIAILAGTAVKFAGDFVDGLAKIHSKLSRPAITPTVTPECRYLVLPTFEKHMTRNQQLQVALSTARPNSPPEVHRVTLSQEQWALPSVAVMKGFVPEAYNFWIGIDAEPVFSPTGEFLHNWIHTPFLADPIAFSDVSHYRLRFLPNEQKGTRVVIETMRSDEAMRFIGANDLPVPKCEASPNGLRLFASPRLSDWMYP